MKSWRFRVFDPVPMVACALALVASVQCGGDETTGRERVTFAVSVRGIHPEFDSAVGWHVVLDQAVVAIGPVRWYEGAPLFGLNLFERMMGVRIACAHPGHYVAGEALADITSQRAIDLLSPNATPLETANGVSGAAQSATLGLHAPGSSLGPAGSMLGTNTLHIRGTASRNGTSIRFQGGIPLNVDVRGIPARGTLAGSSGTWEISVDLAEWLDRADFSTLVPTTDGSPAEILPTEQVGNALYRGTTSAAGYLFSSAPGAPVRDE